MVVSAALLMRERGAHSTAIADVLEHSGAPRGSAYHYFPGGRGQLLCEAVDYAAGYVADAIAGAPTAIPLPVRPTVCGLPVAFEAIAMDAVRAPSAAGAKTTLAVQLACGARLVPAAQLPPRVKSAALAPPRATLFSVSALAPLLVTVTVLAAPGVLTI